VKKILRERCEHDPWRAVSRQVQEVGAWKDHELGKIMNMTRLGFFGLLFACGLSSCSPDGAPVGEAQYSAKIVGAWQGTVGDTKETISFGADGGFVSQVRPRGFISDTLGQGVTGTVSGTWAIKGKSITLNISSAEDVRVLNRATTSTIETFKPNELVVKSAAGGTTKFVRAL
jgi:hypothetical protein